MSNALRDVAYGPADRQRYDHFPGPDTGATMIHFHGGYWAGGAKENNWFQAPALHGYGMGWISVEYRVCPEVSLNEVVDDAVAAFDHIVATAQQTGVNPDRLHLSGHSAGAHLAAMVAAHRRNVASLAIASGLYDLAPLRWSKSQSWLNLTDTAARILSPVHLNLPSRCPVIIGYGSDETEGFRQQSQTYAAHCRDMGCDVAVVELPNHDHFETIGAFTDIEKMFFKSMIAHF